MAKLRRWTKEEDKYLADNYGNIEAKDIAKKLNRTKAAITTRAKLKNLTSTRSKWTENEIKQLKELYKYESMNAISNKLKRNKSSIYVKASELGLVKGGAWSDEELEYIDRNYNKMTNYELAKALDKTTSQIGNIANRMGLNKQYGGKTVRSLTPAEQQAIVNKYKAGETMISLATKYKTTLGEIRLIIGDAQKMKELKKTNDKDFVADKYNLQVDKLYIVSKVNPDIYSILKGKKVWINGLYDNHFVVETDKGIRESISYTDLIIGDYTLKEAN